MALGALHAPGVLHAGLESVESDARTIRWSTLRRLALEGGVFLPLGQPASEGELAELLGVARDGALAGTAPAYRHGGEFSRLEFWFDRYRQGGGGFSLHGCDCKTNPFQLRLAGRTVAGFSDLGDVMAREAGLAWRPGWNATLEPIIDFGVGPWWVSVSARFAGRMGQYGVEFEDPDDPLNWPGWSVPTGRERVREARLGSDAWRFDLPRAMAGVRLGGWALNVGYAPRATGAGQSGSLQLDRNTESFAAATARRTRPFVWGSGFWKYVSPASLQFSSGPLSRRTVGFREGDEIVMKEARPWYFQWLVGWQVEWIRFAVSHSAIAASRDGNLWGDIFQINFPTKGTTWDEVDSGPATDRILATQLEIRWRRAPWPLLPSSAGRLYWDYGGTDTLPSGPGGYVPQISVPASVIGFEMLSPVWDLGLEYAELKHPDVLWYSNSAFPGTGYSHEGWVLGHPLGGSGERWGGLVRWRPDGRGLEAALDLGWSSWGERGQTPGIGKKRTVALTVARDPGSTAWGGEKAPPTVLWEVTLELNRERSDLAAFAEDPDPALNVVRDWWRLYARIGI